MQLPLQPTIQGVNISLILIGVFAFVLIYIFSYWMLSKAKMKPVQIFDTVFIALFMALVVARFLSVMFHFDDYADNLWGVFNLFDKNFFYIGIFLGLLVSVFLVFQNTNKEKDFYAFIEKTVISYAFAIIPLLLLVFLTGRMNGIAVNGGIAIDMGGVLRMPVNLFRIGFNVLFIILWFILRGVYNKKGIMSALYILLFGLLEFILRIFSSGYSAYLLNIIDLQQLAAIVIFIIGGISMFDATQLKTSVNLSRKRSDDNESLLRRQDFNSQRVYSAQTPKERFSLTYANIQDSKVNGNLSPSERLRVFQNTIKRKIKK